MEFYEVINLLAEYYKNYKYFIIPVVIFFITVVPVPFPEDMFILIFGLLAKRLNDSPAPIIFFSFITVQASDLLLYYIGAGALKISEKRNLLYSDFIKKKIEKGSLYFNKYGAPIILAARFTFLLRSSVYLSAGYLKYNTKKFIILNGIAGMIQTPLIIMIGYNI